MDVLLSFFQLIQKSFFAIGPFFLLLGVLIFIHELGHFLVARYFGVKVEVFSLGFGPKILKYKKGDTVYCISLLPLGGYVKMFGDNPLKEVPDSEKEKSFLYRRVYEKWLIAFGGPFMNLIFAVFAFFVLAVYGVSSLPPQLGDIKQDSAAGEAGFQSGDKILSVNGQPVFYREELMEIIKNKINEELVFQVQSQTDEIRTISTIVHQDKNANLLEWQKFVGSIDGLNFHSIGLRIGVVHGSPAYQAGLRTFDEIVVEVNQEKLKYWRDLKAFIETINTPFLSLSVKRESEKKPITVKLSGKHIKAPLSLVTLGIEPAYLYIERVGPDTPAAQAGLKPGDRLVSINKIPTTSWEQVLDTVQSYSGQPFFITYRRQDQENTVLLTPKLLYVEGNAKKRFMLGIASGILEVSPEPIIRERSLPQSFIYSGQETGRWLGFITVGLVRLFQGEMSFRTMGGPVMIGRVAHSSFREGFQNFLFIMAVISLNLFFLNLLPIPMLDGGYILFFTLEGFLGRPLSVKKLIAAQQVGILILISFISFAFFNDIYNWMTVW